MTSLFQDIQFALRSFRKAPVFSVVAVLSLALGIGANTAIFTLVDQLILRLLPVRNPEEMVLLSARGRHYGGNNGINALAYPTYQVLRDKNEVFQGMMCRYGTGFTVSGISQPEPVSGELVSGNYFPLLGVRAAAGRLFTAADDQVAGQHPYAVLSFSYWQTKFNGDPSAIGKTIRANNYPLTIVGVAAPGFEGLEPGLPTQLFVPMVMAPQVRPGFSGLYNKRQRWVNAYGRLKPGLTIGQAKAGLQPLFHQILESEVVLPDFRNATPYDKEQFLRMWLETLPGGQGNSNLRRTYEKPLLVLMSVVGLVLLIACANMASLLTARAAARQKEIAIRLAMGSSRTRMIRQLLTESVMLSVAGGVAGLGLALVIVKGLIAFLPPIIQGYGLTSSPDTRMLGFTFGLALLTGILFGLIPALQSTRANIAPTLKDQAGNVMGSMAQVSFRKVLVSAQVGLSLLLLIGAGLFARSLSNLRTLDPGFTTANIVQFSLNPRSLGNTVEQARTFLQRLDERLHALPGVRAAAQAVVPVLANNEWDNWITIEGYQAKPGQVPDPHVNYVSTGYFDTLRIPVLAGRVFTAKDAVNSPRVSVVNETFARKYFGNSPAIGRRFGMGSDPTTPINIEIVGVVKDTRYESLRDEIPEEVYFAVQQNSNVGVTVYVSTARDPENSFGAVRAAVRELDANLPVLNMKTLDKQLEESVVTERMIATLSGAFGALATVLAIIGLYGVMAYMVTRRSREIGIRMALGAQSGNVVWLVMREVMILVGAGIGAGLPAAYALTRLVKAQLYGVQPNDAASIAAATLLLAVVALLAGYIPARRAAAYDPVRVLRYD